MQRILDLPVFLIFVIIACLMMYLPAIHAVSNEAFHIARSFFYAGTLGLVFCALIGLAMSANPVGKSALHHLVSLLAVFALMPLLLAIPFYEALRTTSFLNAYVEMVSSLTTTGASLFEPERLHKSLHLWRGLVGWMGGFLMWVAASAILGPLNLGGFEVTASAAPGQGALRRMDMSVASPGKRLLRHTQLLAPIYAGLTVALWVSLLIVGAQPFDGLMRAMATLSTSGIMPAEVPTEALSGGIVGEVLVFMFLFFALSRLTFSTDTVSGPGRALLDDPEFRIGLMVVIGVPLLLFVRHWSAAFDVDTEQNLLEGLRALWGSVFTVMSFLTTTGFVSVEWEAARGWSGLETPGVILTGLALIGGGVATTAGGVKLLRVFTLYLNGLREMQKLIHPSSVSGHGAQDRRIRRQGAYTAWVFFMLFALSLAVIVLALTAFGARFDEALVMSVASLSTTGPLLEVAGAEVIRFGGLPDGAKLVFAFSCVLGRLETLAIIALMIPALWRR